MYKWMMDPFHFSLHDFVLLTIAYGLNSSKIIVYIYLACDTDFGYWKDITRYGAYAVRITLAEALVLFIDPAVKRTKELSPYAIPVIRWWQQHRRPGPQRCEDLLMPLLNKRELARIAEYTPTKRDENLRDCTEAESEALEEHHTKFSQHLTWTTEIFKTWFLNEAELEEIGASTRSSARDIMEGLLKSERLLQSKFR
jgi:hypothetical protein